MGLYSAFNALGLGGAAGNARQQIFNNRKSAIDQMAEGLGSILERKRIDDEEKKKRQSAIGYLNGLGVDGEKAEQLADAMGGSDVARLFLGREFGDKDYERSRSDQLTDEQRQRGYRIADRDDERAYEGRVHARNRAEAQSDAELNDRREFDNWLKKNNITYKQGVKSAQFGDLMQQLGIVRTNDYGNSIRGAQDRNNAINAIKEFTKLNPEFADVLSAFDLEGMKGDENYGYYDETINNRLMELADLKDTAQTEAYLQELEDNGKLKYVQNNELFADALSKLLRNSDLKKLSPYLITEGMNKGRTTAPQRVAQIAKADEEAKYNTLKKQAVAAANGKGDYPTLTDKQKKRMKDEGLGWVVRKIENAKK